MTSSGIDVGELVEGQTPTWFAAGVFVLCCLVMLADGFDNQAINYAAPWIIRELQINRALMTPVFNFGIAGSIAGAIVFGMLADRFGRRPATIGAIAMFGGFTLAIPLARDLALLSALRFGATLGRRWHGHGDSLASDYTPGRRRALCVTLLFLGYTLGSSGGGLFAAEIIPRFGWRSVFYAGGAGAIAITGVLLVRLPKSLPLSGAQAPQRPADRAARAAGTAAARHTTRRRIQNRADSKKRGAAETSVHGRTRGHDIIPVDRAWFCLRDPFLPFAMADDAADARDRFCECGAHAGDVSGGRRFFLHFRAAD